MHFENLNADCILLICNYLPPNDLINLAIASCNVADLLSANLLKLRDQLFVMDNGYETCKLIDSLFVLDAWTKLRKVVFFTQETSWYNIWSLFSNKCPNITHISIFFASFQYVEFGHFDHLVHLKLYHISLHEMNNQSLSKLHTLKHLVVIDTTGFQSTCILSLNNLETLCIFHTPIDINEIAAVIEYLHKLIAIDLRGYTYNNEFFRVICRKTYLEEFGFTFDLEHYENFLKLSKLPKLKNIAIEMFLRDAVDSVTLHKIAKLLRNCVNLKLTSHLTLEVQKMINTLTNVEYLNLSQYSNMRWCHIPELTNNSLDFKALINMKTLVLTKVFAPIYDNFELSRLVEKMPLNMTKLIIVPPLNTESSTDHATVLLVTRRRTKPLKIFIQSNVQKNKIVQEIQLYYTRENTMKTSIPTRDNILCYFCSSECPFRICGN